MLLSQLQNFNSYLLPGIRSSFGAGSELVHLMQQQLFIFKGKGFKCSFRVTFWPALLKLKVLDWDQSKRLPKLAMFAFVACK